MKQAYKQSKKLHSKSAARNQKTVGNRFGASGLRNFSQNTVK